MPAVLMGGPAYFEIKGGANPFTRNKFGLRKKVNKQKAIEQWHCLAEALTELGVEVYVLPPESEAPGLVYPANAGVLTGSGQFLLSNLIESRAAEEPYYKSFLQGLGFNTIEVSKRFEGEADLFPYRDQHLFTYGTLKKQQFTFKWGLPPWKRIYGFRSDETVQEELRSHFSNKKMLSVQLVNESYYHGDTALCSFGSNREHLLVYLSVLSEKSQQDLKDVAGSDLIELSDEDARLYAANSFYFETDKKKILVMPEGVSVALMNQVNDLGVEVVCVDVSEFWQKGGGSVKCMIGSLGALPQSENLETSRFRMQHLYKYGTPLS